MWSNDTGHASGPSLVQHWHMLVRVAHKWFFLFNQSTERAPTLYRIAAHIRSRAECAPTLHHITSETVEVLPEAVIPSVGQTLLRLGPGLVGYKSRASVLVTPAIGIERVLVQLTSLDIRFAVGVTVVF